MSSESDSLLCLISLTPRRPCRANSITSNSPNCNSDSNNSHPSTPVRRSPRSRKQVVNTPLGIVPMNEKTTFKNDKEIETTFQANSFYKPNRVYINPFERMTLGKPRITVSLKVEPKKKKTLFKKKVTNKIGKMNNKLKVKNGENKTIQKLPFKKKENIDTNIVPLVEVPKTPPKTLQNDSNLQSPRHSPRTRLCLELQLTPPTPKPAAKRKFFTSRSPKKIRNRFTSTTKNGIFSLKKSSPQNKTKPQETRKPKNNSPVNIAKKIEELSANRNGETKIALNVTSASQEESLNDLFQTPTKKNSPNKKRLHPISVDLTTPKKSNITTTDRVEHKWGTPSPVQFFPIFDPGFKITSNSPVKKPSTSRKLKLGNSKKDKMEQLIIDAGQNKFGAVQCDICNMIYSSGENEDEHLHSEYHREFLSNLRFSGWKKERVVSNFPDGRIILVLPTDANFMIKKVENIRKLVDRDLGYPELGLQNHMNSTYFIFVSAKQVVGCIIAESIKEAYRVLPETKSKDSSSGPFCCSTKSTPAICGISRIWTALSHRRLKIASRLLDCLRCNFIYGHHLAINEFAFSDPSPMGRSFAVNYMKSESFLVYN